MGPRASLASHRVPHLRRLLRIDVATPARQPAGIAVALLNNVRRSSQQTPDDAVERNETTMNHKEDKRISALLIAQLVAELVAYENELAARNATARK